MELCIDAAELRKALADIERAEANGFMYCLAVLRLSKAGPNIDDCRAVYSDLIERGSDRNPNLNWGRFQRVTQRNRLIDWELHPIAPAGNAAATPLPVPPDDLLTQIDAWLQDSAEPMSDDFREASSLLTQARDRIVAQWRAEIAALTNRAENAEAVIDEIRQRENRRILTVRDLEINVKTLTARAERAEAALRALWCLWNDREWVSYKADYLKGHLSYAGMLDSKETLIVATVRASEKEKAGDG